MKTKPMTLANILLATILLASIFLVNAIPSSSVAEYDAWIDLNDDGAINIFDLVQMAGAYGTTGTPIDKTELLLELQSKVAELETRLATLNATKLGAPAYDSGWVSIAPNTDTTFTHNLGTANLLVYVVGKSYAGIGVHQFQYGGDYMQGSWGGIFWKNLNASSVTVQRLVNDNYHDEVRVQIWIVP